jgi:hypothetical protein
MGRSSRVAVTVGWLLAAASLARAQESVPPLIARPVALPAAPIMDFSHEQDTELRRWLAAMQKWRRAHPESSNAFAHDRNGKIIRRSTPPSAPAWLPWYCGTADNAVAVPFSGPLGAGCHLLAESVLEAGVDAIRTQTQAQRADREQTVHSSFLSRLHLDGLWTTPSTNARAYGLLGSHISLVDLGRLQAFGPPGVLLLAVPDGPDSHVIRVGYTWGFSVRLADLRLLSPTKNLTLFVTISKCWTAGGSQPGVASGAFDLVGFSLARRKPHP